MRVSAAPGSQGERGRALVAVLVASQRARLARRRVLQVPLQLVELGLGQRVGGQHVVEAERGAERARVRRQRLQAGPQRGGQRGVRAQRRPRVALQRLGAHAHGHAGRRVLLEVLEDVAEGGALQLAVALGAVLVRVARQLLQQVEQLVRALGEVRRGLVRDGERPPPRPRRTPSRCRRPSNNSY